MKDNEVIKIKLTLEREIQELQDEQDKLRREIKDITKKAQSDIEILNN